MARLNKNYWFLFGGISVSTLGTYLSLLVMDLFIYQTTRSPFLVGVFLLFRLIPAFFVGNIAGVIADKFDRKKIIIISDIVRAILIFTAMFLRESIYPLYVIVFLISIFDRLYQSAIGGSIPNIVGMDNLTEANSYISSGRTIALIAGPMLGGLLISSGSYDLAFGVDALTYIISAGSVFLISAQFHKTAVARSKIRLWKSVKEGYSFVFLRFGLFSIILLRCLDAFGSGALNVGFPIFSSGLKQFSPGICYGLMSAAYGIGEAAGSLFLSRRKFVLNAATEITVGASILFMAIFFGISLNMTSLYYAMFFIFLCGASEGVTMVSYNTSLQKSPDDIRGRVVGFSEASIWSSMAVGMFISGLVAETVDIGRVVTVFAGLVVVGAVIHIIYWKRKLFTEEDICIKDRMLNGEKSAAA